jgi:hypothetical protein
MKRIWGENPSSSVTALMDCVALSTAKVTCTGHPRDEQLCRDVVEILEKCGKTPLVGRKYKMSRGVQGVTSSRAVHNLRKDQSRDLIEAGLWPKGESDGGSDEHVDLQESGGCDDDAQSDAIGVANAKVAKPEFHTDCSLALPRKHISSKPGSPIQ